jgi:hypothetical protein
MPLTTVNQGLLSTDAQYTGFKNRLINGDMTIDQRNNGAAVTVNTAARTFGVDRWWGYGQGTDGVFTIQQSSVAPAGFTRSTLITVTTPDASIGSSQLYLFAQTIEGFNCADLAWGTASAATVTLSFWVRSSVVGTFGGIINNYAQDRTYPFTYAISSANTWEQKSVTIAGDTTGTWNTSNSGGIQVMFGLGTGSSFLASPNAWVAGTYFGATGQTNIISTSGATFYITGVQIEKGNVATSFDVLPYGTELNLCLRYYWRLNTTGSNSPFASGNAENTTRGYINLTLPQPMRTQPSCSISSVSHLALRGVGTDVACTSGNFSASTSSAMATIIGGEFNTGSATGASAGGCVKMSWNNASAWIDASAEL